MQKCKRCTWCGYHQSLLPLQFTSVPETESGWCPIALAERSISRTTTAPTARPTLRSHRADADGPPKTQCFSSHLTPRSPRLLRSPIGYAAQCKPSTSSACLTGRNFPVEPSTSAGMMSRRDWQNGRLLHPNGLCRFSSSLQARRSGCLERVFASSPVAIRAVRWWRVCTCTTRTFTCLDVSALPYLPVMSAVSSNANTSWKNGGAPLQKQRCLLLAASSCCVWCIAQERSGRDTRNSVPRCGDCHPRQPWGDFRLLEVLRCIARWALVTWDVGSNRLDLTLVKGRFPAPLHNPYSDPNRYVNKSTHHPKTSRR